VTNACVAALARGDFAVFLYPPGGEQNPFKAKKFRVYSIHALVAFDLLA
jgi:hypothetical protein